MKKLYDLLYELNIRYKEHWISNYINSNRVKSFKIDGQYYIEDKVYNDIKRLSENKMQLDLSIPDGYVTKKEICKILNMKISRYMLDSIEYISIESENKKNKFYSINSVNKFKVTINEISKYDESEKWMRQSCIKGKTLYGKISRLKKDEDLKSKYFKKLSLGHKNIEFISKEFYEDVLKGLYKIDRSKEKGSYNRKPLLLNKLNNIIEDLKNSNIKINFNDFYSTKEAIEITGLEEEILLLIINNGEIKEHIIKNKNKISLITSGIEKLFSCKEYYNLYKLSECSGIRYSTILTSYNELKKKKNFNEYIFNDRIYVNINIHYEILRIFSKKSIERLKSLEDILNERLKYFSHDYKYTFESAEKFLKNELKLKKDRKTEFLRCINAIDDFINLLNEELYMLDSKEIVDLIITNIKVGYWSIICKFINYSKKNCFKSTKYKKQFGYSLLSQYKISNKKIDEDLYDKKTWVKYHTVLKDIDQHYIEAINNARYAEIWLYCLLNLSITWRKKNIICSLPNIYLEAIQIYDFDWFNTDNQFSLEMAECILNQIKFSLDGVIAFKNKRNLHFNIPLSLKIPTAIAFVICEIHRQKNKRENLLYNLMRRDARTRDYIPIFKNDSKLIKFSNLKCTRSIINYGYSYASNKIGSSSLAYKFYSYGRSHSDNISRITNTTSEYFRLENLEDGIKEYMFHIIERGSFGFMYYKIFESIVKKEDFEILSQGDMTKMIASAKEKISPLTIENSLTKLLDRKELNDYRIYELILMEVIKNIDRISNENSFYNIKSLLINSYKEKASELIGECKGLDRFIDERYRSMDKAFDELSKTEVDSMKILENIFNGNNNCYTEHTNCIFAEIEREKLCLYYSKGIGISSCSGCKYNLLTTYSLYEIGSKLNGLLDYLLNSNHLEENEIIKSSHIIKVYLSLTIEGLVHFNKENNYIEKIVNLKTIKKKIVELLNINKIINFK